MYLRKTILQDIFNITDQLQFNDAAIEIFHYQYEQVEVYNKYINLLKINPSDIKNIKDIPFLPIEFFKSNKIIAKGMDAEIIFSSSGTTGSGTSRHYIADKDVYINSFTKCFEYFYGKASEYNILALLPSYQENNNSSLVFMVDNLIKQSTKEESGYYLNENDNLIDTLKKLSDKKSKTLLLGVSYALLDIAEKFNDMHLNDNIIVMETGGMKGRRKEIVREELHGILSRSFGVKHIHSEYGMTELLSQAYSKGEGRFNCPPCMKVIIRDTNDPFTYQQEGKTGGINVIDLANIYSCSFIETGDLAKTNEDDSFSVLGRFDYSDIRGCNLLIS